MLAAAGVTAAVAAMPVIVVPGVLAYGILTWLRYTRWRDRDDQAGGEPVAVDLSRLRHPYSSRAAMCVQLQSRVLADIAGADPMHKAMLQPSIDRVRSLAQAAAEMAYKLQQIDDHLSREDVRSLENEESFLKNRLQGTQDPRGTGTLRARPRAARPEGRAAQGAACPLGAHRRAADQHPAHARNGLGPGASHQERPRPAPRHTRVLGSSSLSTTSRSMSKLSPRRSRRPSKPPARSKPIASAPTRRERG